MLEVADPIALKEKLWPDVQFYPQQEEIIYSVANNDETIVVAGNQLGKDYVAGFIALSFFLAPEMYFPIEYVESIESLRTKNNPSPHTVRIITTSVREDHLEILWGEIGRFIQTSIIPLLVDRGGLLVSTYHNLTKLAEPYSDRILCKVSYLIGMVSKKGEGMAGHHAAYTLQIIDEASGADDQDYDMASGWAKKRLIFGNPNQCQNFFRKGVEAGDLLAKEQ